MPGTDTSALIKVLESGLLDYVEKYGCSEKARFALSQLPLAHPNSVPKS